jgi:hypothetical protein
MFDEASVILRLANRKVEPVVVVLPNKKKEKRLAEAQKGGRESQTNRDDWKTRNFWLWLVYLELQERDERGRRRKRSKKELKQEMIIERIVPRFWTKNIYLPKRNT